MITVSDIIGISVVVLVTLIFVILSRRSFDRDNERLIESLELKSTLSEAKTFERTGVSLRTPK